MLDAHDRFFAPLVPKPKRRAADLLLVTKIEFKLIASDPPKAHASGGLLSSAANRSPDLKVIERPLIA
jgi:hypothetical protein